ncbi:ATP-binding protein [Paraburkholderia bryophila]|uniref:Putative ATPase/DNA-binding winged helix-turn-helix (WHTH) protein n=1 Tax=Paraburkholderia bryophila TaxID=420952 RepID=A0A7Z0AYS6_9BURK|nr:winged helix-turn-helix domain-containing protein [Paraburkholderia bryophila]NYH14931.1 putative ATPase/DNA-binding winged helix-turn-helix (wHTH) protein [Paraburkholderia bryophila]
MIEIGSFQIDLGMRTLRKNGEVVHVGSRAFDILAVVASAGGRLVTKDELMDTVWPNTVVEENNVQVHLSALRKILGADRDLILTVPGRGYQLLQRRKNASAAQFAAPVSHARSLPPSKAGLQGRDNAVRQIRAMLSQTPVLTLVGAGGIGKTSLAIEAARHTADDFKEPVSFVELATLSTESDVLRAIADTCGLDLPELPTVAQLVAAFGQQLRLLVLDNAEHVIGAIATIVDAIVAGNDQLRVLVTSREPLRILPEAIFRVDPLDVPLPQAGAAEILRCSAVKLFLQRANSLQGAIGADPEELRLVGEICRRLDGIPLAIELAAARVVALGVEGVYRRLDDRMAILAGGYRTALPRHQTLRATFDWSFAILDTDTRTLFRRLAIFGGSFTFEAMCAVTCDSEHSVANAISAITELVAKSLVNVEFDGPVAKYRLSESTRAYALEKLVAEGELQIITSRNARYLSSYFQAQTDESQRHHATNPQERQQTLEDARVACDWAFSPNGDARVGVELASNLVGALLDAGLIEECCTRATQAMDALDALPAGTVDTASDMRVRAALASALPYVCGPVSKAAQLWRDVLARAAATGDQAFQAHALWGLWNTMLSLGNINESINVAQQFQQLAVQHGTPWQKILADQIGAISQHCHGRHALAKAGLENVAQRIVQMRRDAQSAGCFAVDPAVYCNGTLGRIAWLQGDPDAATALIDTVVDTIRPDTLEPSLTHVLGATVIPFALMSGDLARGSRYIDIMRSQAALHGFTNWLDYCDCLAACHDILEGRAGQALAVLDTRLDALMSRGFRRLITPFIVAYAEALIEQGRIPEATTRLNDARDFCRSNGELFFLPEVWRAFGLAAQAEAAQHAKASEAYEVKIASASACFSEARQLAREQGAKMWELRASTAMARLLDAQDRTEEAIGLLAPLVAELQRAAGTSDAKAAQALLGKLYKRSGKSDAKTRNDVKATSKGAVKTVRQGAGKSGEKAASRRRPAENTPPAYSATTE